MRVLPVAIRKETRDRIYARCKKVPGRLDTPCWEWQGARDDQEYGKVKVLDEVVRVHQVSFMCTHGELPPEKVVRHKCDNPRCCCPAHLEVGTQQQNMQDMVERGRHVGNRSLTQEQVDSIRHQKMKGTPIKKLAHEYGVQESTVHAILSGQNWGESADFLEE